MKNILNGLSIDEAWRHLEWLNENAPTRISGTPDQIRAAEYFVEQLDSYGLEARLDSFTAYRSVPLKGSFTILSPESLDFPCEPCGHIVSTPDEGLEVDLIYLGPGAEEDYEGRDVRGAAVLTEIAAGPSRPKKAYLAARHGAAVIIFINWGLPEFDTIPCGAIKCVWGNPTRSTMPDVPQIAALGISREAGNSVIGMLADGGTARARIVAQATRDWGPLIQPWARIRAPNNPTGDFLVIGGHHDAWKPGMTDNAAGNRQYHALAACCYGFKRISLQLAIAGLAVQIEYLRYRQTAPAFDFVIQFHKRHIEGACQTEPERGLAGTAQSHQRNTLPAA